MPVCGAISDDSIELPADAPKSIRAVETLNNLIFEGEAPVFNAGSDPRQRPLNGFDEPCHRARLVSFSCETCGNFADHLPMVAHGVFCGNCCLVCTPRARRSAKK